MGPIDSTWRRKEEEHEFEMAMRVRPRMVEHSHDPHTWVVRAHFSGPFLSNDLLYWKKNRPQGQSRTTFLNTEMTNG